MPTIKQIMLIDDDQINNLVSKQIIKHFDASILVEEYEDPELALEYLTNQAKQRIQTLPDIIFLDLNMPLINGWSFLEAYKHLLQDLNKNIELYLLTSSNNQKDIQKAQDFPIVSRFIPKPLSLEALSKIREDYSA